MDLGHPEDWAKTEQRSGGNRHVFGYVHRRHNAIKILQVIKGGTLWPVYLYVDVGIACTVAGLHWIFPNPRFTASWERLRICLHGQEA